MPEDVEADARRLAITQPPLPLAMPLLPRAIAALMFFAADVFASAVIFASALRYASRHYAAIFAGPRFALLIRAASRYAPRATPCRRRQPPPRCRCPARPPPPDPLPIFAEVFTP
jgi:hypothetical protein